MIIVYYFQTLVREVPIMQCLISTTKVQKQTSNHYRESENKQYDGGSGGCPNCTTVMRLGWLDKSVMPEKVKCLLIAHRIHNLSLLSKVTSVFRYQYSSIPVAKNPYKVFFEGVDT